MKEFQSFFKAVGGNEGSKCRYSTRLDTYGCGCAHDCAYCYAKSLLNFRGLWDANEPRVADADKVRRKIDRLPPGSWVRLGGMTDCFQPCEAEYRVTAEAIKALNERGVNYLIVTKSDMVSEYAYLMDRSLAHIQISITWIPAEKAVSTERRIRAVEMLNLLDYDVSVRLSPYVPQFVNFERLNAIKCPKILVEFLRVNYWIKKWLPIDYSEYTVKQSGYLHLSLDKKMAYLSKITGFDELSVCEDVTEHYQYWREAVNHNKDDCCNLRKEWTH